MNGSLRWSTEKAAEWYARQPWLVGCNFIPSTAVNQLEMWQAESFDPNRIDCELGWAAGIGFNTVRTFLHDLAWHADPQGFKQRLDRFLDIASRHGIRPILVFFDDCWNPDPKLGAQPAPRPRIHNSGWVQSPGIAVVNQGPVAWNRLEAYVTDIVGSFAADDGVLLWDLYNEPGNGGNQEKSLPLLKAVFEWARRAHPPQPLTAGLWFDNIALNEFQVSASDVITFHNYGPADGLRRQIADLKTQQRPLICTEWLARACGSLVSTHLPVFAREKVGCINWGLVSGKTNTIYPWESLSDRDSDPMLSRHGREGDSNTWFHDLLWDDGRPYDQEEIDLFKRYVREHRPRPGPED